MNSSPTLPKKKKNVWCSWRFFFFFFFINLTNGYDERDLYVKQNRQHTMVPTKTQATKPVHFHSAKTAQSSDQPNTRCRGGKAQSNKHYQGKL
ncbi:hypothetical protein ABBQ32_006486 [Trebouxia sp. C0010 RCD-2024]